MRSNITVCKSSGGTSSGRLRPLLVTSMPYVYLLTVTLLVTSYTKLSQEQYVRAISLKRHLVRALGYTEMANETRGGNNLLSKGRVLWKYLDKDERDRLKHKEVGAPRVPSLDIEAMRFEPEIIEKVYPLNPLEIVANTGLKIKSNVKVTVREEVWQKVLEDGTLLVYSAAYDIYRGSPFVRVLGMNGNSNLPRVLCRLAFPNSSTVVVRGRLWELPDQHNKVYSAVFVTCPLPEKNPPSVVNIIPERNPVLRNALPVLYHSTETRMFTVCMAPLYFNRSVAHELVQWIELNKLLGADKFFIYNYSSEAGTNRVLKHYEQQGTIDIIDWHPPQYTDMHYYGQMAMVNDCLLRNQRVSRYMVIMDLDEVIVPRSNLTTWYQLVQGLPLAACELNVRSSLVLGYSDKMFEDKQLAEDLRLDSLLRVKRQEYIFPKNDRSKYIVNTSCVDTVGIHYCWRYRDGAAKTQRHHVTPQMALTFHYRSQPTVETTKEVEDLAVYKYHKELIRNVRQRWLMIENG